MPRKYMPNWREGAQYRIRYKSQLGNYQWWEYEVVMTFAGVGTDSSLIFSLRPLAGTQDMKADQILWVDEMPKGTKHKMPRKIRRMTKEEAEA